jgi:hypothetical protein
MAEDLAGDSAKATFPSPDIIVGMSVSDKIRAKLRQPSHGLILNI